MVPGGFASSSEWKKNRLWGPGGFHYSATWQGPLLLGPKDIRKKKKKKKKNFYKEETKDKERYSQGLWLWLLPYTNKKYFQLFLFFFFFSFFFSFSILLRAVRAYHDWPCPPFRTLLGSLRRTHLTDTKWVYEYWSAKYVHRWDSRETGQKRRTPQTKEMELEKREKIISWPSLTSRPIRYRLSLTLFLSVCMCF